MVCNQKIGTSTCNNSLWAKEEDQAFENALAIYSYDSNLWEKIVAAVPGRTVEEIKIHYEVLVADVNAIELGLVPLPHYADSFMNYRGISMRSNRDHKKGRPWSKEEHRLFLQGLDKYGRGDWRSISRLCVRSRTPTQVASHAQKYFKRMVVVDKKMMSSTHDVTILDGGKIVTQQVQTTQLVAGASGGSFIDTGLYPSENNKVGDRYLHGSLIDSQCNIISHVPNTEDISAGINLLESLLDSLADTLTPQGPSSQKISESTGVHLCTLVNVNQHMPTYGEVVIEDTITPADLEIFNSLFIFQHNMSNSQGPIMGEVIGTVNMLNFEALPFPAHLDFDVHAPPTASQLTLELLPSVRIQGSFPYPGSLMFEMDSPNFVAFLCDEPDDMATPAY
ncbi:unnamed protein product [Coffea canephora]|uniref:Uncharacterized protein n=1 Tax=Coffea canephora TaxID=49390 RepID=A0A068U0B2_COFCA|nr:unnamed protein product [Coffea canephora]